MEQGPSLKRSRDDELPPRQVRTRVQAANATILKLVRLRIDPRVMEVIDCPFPESRLTRK